MSKTWRKDAAVSFELTNDMSHEVVTHDDNTKTDWLKAGKKRSGGDWVFSATVQTEDTQLTATDSAKASDSPIKVFCSRLAGGSVVEGGYANGKAAFFIEKKPLRLFGTFIALYRVGLAFEAGAHEIVTIEKTSGPDDEPQPLTVDEARWLIKLGESVRLKGRALNLSGADASRLAKKMVVDFDAENDESAIDLKVGLTLSVNGGEETDGGVISLSEAPAKAKKRAASRKNLSRYDEHVSFDLPKDYLFMDGFDSDGDRAVQIKVNSGSDNETDYKVNLVAPDGASSRRKVLDILEDGKTDADVDRRWRFDGPPKALLSASIGNSSVFGLRYSILDVRLALALSDKQALQITWGSLVTDDGEEKLRSVINGLKTIWASVIVDGRKAVPGDVDIGELFSAVHESRDAKEAEDSIALSTEVREDGRFIEVGGRWRMELPYGTRARLQKRGEDEAFDDLVFELDRRNIGHGYLGRTVREQKEASSAMQSILLGLSMDGEDRLQKIFDATVRDDEDIKVQLGLFISASGSNAAKILIEEKRPVHTETCLLMAPPQSIENLGEALQKLQNKETMIHHPFGQAWEQYWRITLRMATSIVPVGREPEQITLSAPQRLGTIGQARLPQDLKQVKGGENEADVYAPADRALTRKDLEHVSQFPYYIIHVNRSLPENDRNDEIPMALSNQVSANSWCHALVGPFATVIHENSSDSGCKTLLLMPENGTYVAFVCVYSADGKWDQLKIDTASGYCPGKLLSLANAIYDSIVLDTDAGSTIPHAYPLPADLLHEHYDLVRGGNYTTHRDADFVGQPIRMLMEKCHQQNEDAYDEMRLPDDAYSLDQKARGLAKVFRLEEGMFDPYSDTEALIRRGMFANARMLHALRSLGWMVMCQSDRDRRELQSFTFEELRRMGEHIESRSYLNYCSESWCSGLISHYDWHVFFVPDAYIEGDTSDSTDLRLLCGKENRGGNSFHIISPLFNMMDRTNDIISRCEETLESLEALRKDLIDLLPVMQTIYDGFMQDRDLSQPLEGVLADALTAWCALAIAAKEPFYSEEAADTPEANAGLDGPLARPADEDAGIASRPRPSAAAPRKRPTPPLPAGEVLDLGGATVITPGQFAGNMTLRNIIIPEGVTEIGEQAFNTCMFLETVALPKSLKKIGKMAFMSCRSLRQVEIPEGVEEIDNHAFGATNNLKEVHLPDSLKVVHRCIFGVGGDSPYATAYMSGELAKRLQENGQNPQWMSAVYARRYVIDGVGYENMYDFWKPGSTGTSCFAQGFPLPMDDKEREKRKEQYRPDMEAAVSSDKSLDEMIEAGRKAPSFFRNEEAYENAIKHLDRNAVVTLNDKHFVLTGFGDNEEEVIAEIKKHGGEVHSSMVKKADYLVVCLMGDPGAGKLNKALEWRQKGATNLIVSDYQLWQAMLGTGAKLPKAAEPAKPDGAASASKAPKAKESAGASTVPSPTAGESNAQSSAAPQSPVEQGNRLEDHLSHDEIVLKGNAFAFSGITVQSWDILADRLEMAGCFLRQDVTGKTDYLVVRDIHGNANTKTKKAMEFIGKGKALKIVLLEDLERALDAAGATTEAIRERNLKRAEEARRKREEEEERKRKQPQVLDLHGARTVEEHEFEFGNKNGESLDALYADILDLPEGLEQILGNGFAWCNMKEVRLPKSLRLLDGNAFLNCQNLQKVVFQEGLTEIRGMAFGGKNKLTDVYLPASLRRMDNDAFAEEPNRDAASHITLHMSGSTARRLQLVDPYPGQPWAIPTERVKAVVIDGERYDSVAAYQAEVKRQEQAERERVRLEQEEARKAEERKRLQGEIDALTTERDSLKGLFAGMKRKKLQKQIDDLSEQLRRL